MEWFPQEEIGFFPQTLYAHVAEKAKHLELSLPPAPGEVLHWNGNHWESKPTLQTIPDGTILDQKINSISATKISGYISLTQLASGGCSPGEFLQWNGVTWVCEMVGVGTSVRTAQ